MTTPSSRPINPVEGQYLGGEPSVTAAFLLEVDGVQIGLFATVRGLEMTSTTEDVVEGGQNGFVHKLPGRFTWPNVTFSRGVTQADALFDWAQKTSGEGFSAGGNKLVRNTGAITAMSGDGKRLRSWTMDAVFPVRWKGPDFDVTSTSPLVEELEVAHHGFRASTL